MKNFRKIICILVVLVIISSMSLSVFANRVYPSKGVVFHQDIYYKGPHTSTIGVGDYNLNSLKYNFGFANDWASSVEIASGYEVYMYEHNYFGGKVWRLDRMDYNSENFTLFGANDKVSSVKVRKK